MITPMPFTSVGDLTAGITNALAVDPLLPLFLMAAGVAGIAFLLIKRALALTK